MSVPAGVLALARLAADKAGTESPVAGVLGVIGGGGGGQEIGQAVGTAIGTAILPGLGTVVGGALGSILGGSLGAKQKYPAMGPSISSFYATGMPPDVAVAIYHYVLRTFKSTGDRQRTLMEWAQAIPQLAQQLGLATRPTMQQAQWEAAVQSASCGVTLSGGYATGKRYGVWKGC